MLVIVVSVVFFIVVSTVSGALVLRAAGIGIPAIQLGVWGPKVKGRIGESTVSLSPWLFSGSVTFKDAGNIDNYDNVPGELFSSLGRLPRAFMMLVGPAVILFCSVLIIGSEAVQAFTAAFYQIPRGALSPFTYAQELLASFWPVVSESPLEAAALVMGKIAALAFMPIPPFSGGQVLMELSRSKGATHGRSAMVFLQLGMLIVLLLVVSWIAALGYSLVHSGAI